MSSHLNSWLTYWLPVIKIALSLAALSSQNKTQHLPQSLDASSHTEAVELILCYWRLRQCCACCLWWTLHCLSRLPPPPYFSRSWGLKGKRWLMFRMLAPMLYASSCALIFSGPLNYLLWENGYWVLKIIPESQMYMVMAEFQPLEGQCNLF